MDIKVNQIYLTLSEYIQFGITKSGRINNGCFFILNNCRNTLGIPTKPTKLTLVGIVGIVGIVRKLPSRQVVFTVKTREHFNESTFGKHLVFQ